MRGEAVQKRHSSAATANDISTFALASAVAAVFGLRGDLKARRISLFEDNAAACASPAEGARRNQLTLTLVDTLRSVAAKFDLAFWLERVPPGLNPPGSPSRSALQHSGHPIPLSNAAQVRAPRHSDNIPFLRFIADAAG